MSANRREEQPCTLFEDRCIAYLLSVGASARLLDHSRQTPLDTAVSSSQRVHTVRLLLQHSDVDAQDASGSTPLHEALKFRPLAMDSFVNDIVEELVKYGANVNIRDEIGCTPLHYAAKNGDASLVKYLVLAGADVNVCNYEGSTPLWYARFRRYEPGAGAIVAFLKRHGALERLTTGVLSPFFYLCAFSNYFPEAETYRTGRRRKSYADAIPSRTQPLIRIDLQNRCMTKLSDCRDTLCRVLEIGMGVIGLTEYVRHYFEGSMCRYMVLPTPSVDAHFKEAAHDEHSGTHRRIRKAASMQHLDMPCQPSYSFDWFEYPQSNNETAVATTTGAEAQDHADAGEFGHPSTEPTGATSQISGSQHHGTTVDQSDPVTELEIVHS